MHTPPIRTEKRSVAWFTALSRSLAGGYLLHDGFKHRQGRNDTRIFLPVGVTESVSNQG